MSWGLCVFQKQVFLFMFLVLPLKGGGPCGWAREKREGVVGGVEVREEVGEEVGEEAGERGAKVFLEKKEGEEEG